MSGAVFDMRETALLLLDLQNDFIHPDGAYGRGGQKSDDIAALTVTQLNVFGTAEVSWLSTAQIGALPADARDLLNKIFEVDPSKRITVEGIRAHPWYARPLKEPELAEALERQDAAQRAVDAHIAHRRLDTAKVAARVAALWDAIRAGGGMVVATLFTLPPGRGGEPIISPHLKQLRPFLRKGDFAPGAWGQALVDELAPADACVEKIAYSAFYMTRLEYVLRKSGVTRLICAGIVTNGGVASTVRDAHVREFDITVLADGCATFSRRVHEVSIEALRPVARIATVAEILAEIPPR